MKIEEQFNHSIGHGQENVFRSGKYLVRNRNIYLIVTTDLYKSREQVLDVRKDRIFISKMQI